MKKALLPILFSILLSVIVFPQSPKPKAQEPRKETIKGKDQAPLPSKEDTSKNSATNQETKALIANQQLALQRLELLLAEIKYVDNQERQVILSVKIADALWPFDEARARQLFKDAFTMIESLESPGKKGGSALTKVANTEAPAKPKDSLRQEVLRTISNRDSDLADALAQSIVKTQTADVTKEVATKAQPSGRVTDLRLNLAMAIAETNPEKAATILNDTLQSGIQYGTIGVLLRIRQKNAEIADNLFTKIVAISDGNPTYYSYETLKMLGLYIADHSHQALQPKQVNQVVATQLLRFAYKVISYQIEAQLSGKGSPETGNEIAASYVVLQQLSPLFEKFLPEESIAVKARLKELSLLIPSRLKDSTITAASKDPDSVKELLALADVTQDFDKKDSLLMRAAILAARQGNIDEGLTIAERQNNYEERKFTKSLICSLGVTEAIAAKDLEKAYKYARNISDLQNLSDAFVKMANLALTKKESEQAKELINEAAMTINKSDESASEKAWCLLRITETALKLDLELATQLAVAAVSQINAADWGKTSSRKESRYKAPVTLERFQFDPIFTPLARTNFERTLEIASGVEKKDLAILAQLSACRAYLEKPYDKVPKADTR